MEVVFQGGLFLCAGYFFYWAWVRRQHFPYDTDACVQIIVSSNASLRLLYAVMEMVEEKTKAIENGEYSLGIYIDLQKAFDIIDHSILLRKLKKYGVRGA